MLGMAMDSAKLFVTGKLFQDHRTVLRQMLIAIAVGVVILYGLAQVAPVWIAAGVAGAVAGFLQPILSKNLKYA